MQELPFRALLISYYTYYDLTTYFCQAAASCLSVINELSGL